MIFQDVGHQTVATQPHDLSESRLIFRDLLFEKINDILVSNVIGVYLDPCHQFGQYFTARSLMNCLDNFWHIFLKDWTQGWLIPRYIQRSNMRSNAD